MKRLIVTLVVAGVMVGISSCAFKEEKTTPVDETADNAQTIVTDAVKDDRAQLCELPEEANDAFNTVINAVKNISPLEKGMNRQYGYKGKQDINGAECYLFSVYDFDEDNSSVKVGEFAKEVTGEAVYKVSDSGCEQIELSPENEKLTLSKSGNTSKKMLKNAAALAAEKVIEG